MINRLTPAVLAGAILVSSGCTFPSGQGSGGTVPSAKTGPGAGNSSLRRSAATPISHVVVIIQENRTVDNLFNGFPGADTVTGGKNKLGQYVPLGTIPLTAPYDLGHRHSSWLNDYDRGKMDGFSQESMDCYEGPKYCPKRDVASYGMVPRSEVEPYWTLAERYTFADEMFATPQGPSFPAHQYLISGTSTIGNGSSYRASENATDPVGDPKQGGCDSVYSATVETIDEHGNAGPFVYPCFDRDSIMRLMDQNDVSWHYYQEFGGPGQWHGPDAIENIRRSPSYANVKWPSSTVLEDITRGDLASVTFVTPSAAASDHAGKTDGSGPSWVASVVNTIGKSPYWKSTAIIVVWDDWGGWYDHDKPTIYNSFELGYRVPMLVISPYAKTAHVSHVHYEFGSILKFIEETFGLPSLNTTDRRANGLGDCFDFGAQPRAFRAIPAKYSATYFERRPVDNRSVDDDE